MSKKVYNLRISCSNEDQLYKVSKLFDVKAIIKRTGNILCFEVEENENDKYFDFINYFLDTLEGKYVLLESMGISKEDISIWLLYEYEDQCNMEFSPSDLRRVGIEGISFCISCWAS